jgi:hypothetical protein
MNTPHLKVLSPAQMQAFQALGLGPQWVPRFDPTQISSADGGSETLVAFGPAFSDSQRLLFGNMLRAIGLDLSDVSFDQASHPAKVALTLQLGECSFEFPSPESMISDAKSKAAAWVLLKRLRKSLN